MARDFKPRLPFSTPLILLVPTQNKSLGVHSKTYPDVEDGIKIFGTFKTYGGTEKNVDGVYSIVDTAVVETWYRPDITSDCVIVIAGTDERYEILNTPENINRRNQFLTFKVQRIKGGA